MAKLMIGLTAVLKDTYPNLKPDEIVIRDNLDGRGEYIARWDRPEPQPTSAELEALFNAYHSPEKAFAREKEKRTKDVYAEVAGDIQSRYSPVDILVIDRLKAGYTEADRAEMWAFIENAYAARGQKLNQVKQAKKLSDL